MWYNISGFPEYEITKNGKIRHKKFKKLKSIYINDSGYKMVSINRNAKSSPQRVHRLLALTFIPNLNKMPHINHKDGDKYNNDLSNLEWTNILLNNQHGFKKGLINNTGENNGMSRLKENEVKSIKKILSEGGLSQYKISKIYNVSRSCISGIKLGRLWRHI